MDRLDRLGWAAGISFATFGVRIGVRVSSPDLLDQVLAHSPAGWTLASSDVERLYSLVAPSPIRTHVRKFCLLYGNDQRLARTENIEELLEVFESDLNSYVARTARRWLFVHAGVVGWKGRAIVIPGATLSGKSTLVKEFLRIGAAYYSDEFAVLDGRGRVHPFPKSLSIRNADGTTQTRVTAEGLGGKTGSRPLPIGLVLLTRHKPGARWRPRVWSQGNGILGLLANTLVARHRPARALATLEKAISKSQVLWGPRGEAKETVESILQCWTSSIATVAMMPEIVSRKARN